MFLSIFSTVLLPLVLVAGVGYLLGRYAHLNPGPMAHATFYVFNPSLIFVSLSTTAVAPELLGVMALMKLLGYVVLVPLAWGAAGRLKLVQPTANAFIMAVLFANSGNYGLAVNEYAFGRQALALAAISFITDNLMVNSLGVYLAARGHASMRAALGQVWRNPALYAIPLGLLAHEVGWVAPLPLARALDLLSRAAVPTMLIVLGLQLSGLATDRQKWGPVGLAALLRLVFAPLLTIGLTAMLGVTGLARQVAITQAAVPTAVTASIVAGRYDTAPEFMASAILLTSLMSLVSVTVILTWLM